MDNQDLRRRKRAEELWIEREKSPRQTVVIPPSRAFHLYSTIHSGGERRSLAILSVHLRFPMLNFVYCRR